MVSMGTYTANYQLYMPTVGENGWGTLINGNFETIDSTMGNLNTRLTTAESKISSIGDVDSEYVFNGDVYGNVYGKLYVEGMISTGGETVYATAPSKSASISKSASASAGTYNTTQFNLTYNDFTYNTDLTYPLRIGPGIYIKSESDLGEMPTERLAKITVTGSNGNYGYIIEDGAVVATTGLGSTSAYVHIGSTVYGRFLFNTGSGGITFTIEPTSYYVSGK